MEKGKVISSSKIDNQPWVYEVVLADDECHVNAKLRPEDEKVIGGLLVFSAISDGTKS